MAASVEAVNDLVERILKPATLGAIHDRMGQRSTTEDETETLPIFIVYVKRPKPGQIVPEPTSFPK